MRFSEFLDEAVDVWRKQSVDLSKINQNEVDYFVNVMSSKKANLKSVIAVVNGSFDDEIRYEKNIGGNLLKVQHQELKQALGIISLRIGKFQFDNGYLEIIHEPCMYAKYDRTVLHSYLIHELIHALDWIDPAYKKWRDVSPAKWDAQEYAKHLMEARAYKAQLDYLFSQIKNRVVIEKALENSSFFKMDSEILEIAKEYLALLPVNEEVVYIKYDEVKINKFIFTLYKFINTMLFRNFVRKA